MREMSDTDLRHTPVRFLDMERVNAPFIDGIAAALADVARSGRYLNGPRAAAFETMLAEGCGAAHCVAVSNGLDALRLIFKAYILTGRLRPGDAVVVPANTYIASVLPLTELGLRPVWTEPDPLSMNLDWEAAERTVDADPLIKAILTVHLYGAPAWDDAVARRLADRGLLLVEDNAQAIGARTASGARTGALGHAAAFSFYPTKNIGALGDAGAVATSDASLAAAVRALANYGSDRRYHNIYCGLNCRMDETQAAVLALKLRALGAVSAARRERAALYQTLITNPLVVRPQWHPGAVWHQYVVRVEERDRFRRFLAHHGVETDIHYATPPHLQPCYAGSAPARGALPVTERIANTAVSLPVASASLSEVAAVSRLVNAWR